jgi:hypothetical protein
MLPAWLINQFMIFWHLAALKAGHCLWGAAKQSGAEAPHSPVTYFVSGTGTS